MKVRLFDRDTAFDPRRKLPAHAQALIDDLGLDALLDAMSEGDEILRETARRALVEGVSGDVEVVLYRQAVLKDCLRCPDVVRELYEIALEAEERRRRTWYGVFTRTPGGILHDAIELLTLLVELLGRLRGFVEENSAGFESEGFRALFETLRTELADSYLEEVKTRLVELRFPEGVFLSAELGVANAGTNYVLRPPPKIEAGWFARLFARRSPVLSFRLDEHDEAGPRILSEMRDRGIDAAANAAGQSADHVLSFFSSLRDELAFYIACERLHRRLAEKGVPVCFPVPREGGARKRACKGLRDAGLALRLDGVVGNELEADGKDVVVITGANQGGKSTFLRAVGLAQLMMQCGMFVAADSFRASVCDGLFTHFRREEDAALESGKFDEELSRMSALADALKPGALVLFNESFAATNDREGSEVAGQIVRALRDSGVEVFYVTHLSDFARALWEEKSPAAHFLRAERLPDGRRTYRLPAGEPLETSFGADLYREVFGDSAAS